MVAVGDYFFAVSEKECHRAPIFYFFCCPHLVIVRTRAPLVPPLEQARLPVVPPGVLTVTLAVPGPDIWAVVIVACNSSLLTNVVASAFPLMTTTEAETNWLPFTVS